MSASKDRKIVRMHQRIDELTDELTRLKKTDRRDLYKGGSMTTDEISNVVQLLASNRRVRIEGIDGTVGYIDSVSLHRQHTPEEPIDWSGALIASICAVSFLAVLVMVSL